MDKRKADKYHRIYNQISTIVKKCDIPTARMATIAAILSHKMDFFWCGFYLKEAGKLVVGPYQGPVACMELPKNKGICWAAVDQKETLIIDDVETFPGHIACDSRSKSEVVIPIKNRSGEIVAVLDIDSDKLSSFDKLDAEWLEKITKLIY